MQDQVQWAGGGGVLFSLYGHMHRSEVSPPYMGQGAVMRMKHKASWSTVTLMDAVVARGVAASVHMAESRCKSLDVFIVPVQLTGCWWKCDKYTVCCISSCNMCAHTQNNWPEYKCIVRVNGRRLSRNCISPQSTLPQQWCYQLNICCQIFFGNLTKISNYKNPQPSK